MLKLILPVIFPSWRFFSSIGASPRVQLSFLESQHAVPTEWQDFRAEPQRVSFTQGVARLFFNSRWNESLYINTCAERLFEEYSLIREQEIMHRVLAAIACGEVAVAATDSFVMFRINALVRTGTQVDQQTVFVSQAAMLMRGAL